MTRTSDVPLRCGYVPSGRDLAEGSRAGSYFKMRVGGRPPPLSSGTYRSFCTLGATRDEPRPRSSRRRELAEGERAGNYFKMRAGGPPPPLSSGNYRSFCTLGAIRDGPRRVRIDAVSWPRGSEQGVILKCERSAPSTAEFILRPRFARTGGGHPASSAGQALPRASREGGKRRVHFARFFPPPRAERVGEVARSAGGGKVLRGVTPRRGSPACRWARLCGAGGRKPWRRGNRDWAARRR